MSRRHIYYVLIIVLIVALSLASVYFLKVGQPPASPANTLMYYTEQFPPYNYQENGTLKGIAIDLLTEITERTGSKVTSSQIHLVPWTEAYKAILTEKNIVLFSMARLPEREQSFKWAGPIFTDTYVLFAKWDRNFTVNNVADLEGFKIGVITDSAAILQLVEAGVDESQLIYDTNASVLIERLSNGEIDFWCYPQTVGRSIAEQLTGNYYSFKSVFELNDCEFYYAFSKDIPDATVSFFQQAINDVKQEKDSAGISTYEKILGRYIPTSGTTTSPEELVKFVREAYEYTQQHGKEFSLNEFNNQTGRFVKGELYIFAYDSSGDTLALPFQPELLGTNRWNTTDPNGTAFIQEIIRTAQSGGGFVRYFYSDPSHNFNIRPKVSYVIMINQDWLIGSGIYEAIR